MLLYLVLSAFVFARLSVGDRCQVNQHCDSCRSGTGECLNGCFDGYYDRNCDLPCSPNCRNRKCKLGIKGDGECTKGCIPGYYGTSCGLSCGTPSVNCQKCPGGCNSGFCQLNSKCFSNCSRSYFGRACKTCPGECNSCNQITGKCEDCPNCLAGNCSEGCKDGCRPGYYGKSCEAKCSEHCILGCHQTLGRCTSCRIGWHGPFCDLNCSTGCLDSCVRNGSCVNGCVRGFYGEKCNRPCPPNCFNDHCFSNGSCNACNDGFFGRECDRICENCDSVCNIDSGICRQCKQFFAGSRCDLDCQTNCSLPACEAFGLCQPEQGYDDGEVMTGEENYVPYYAVSAMVLVVLVLSAYVIRRLKRMNSLVYSNVKNHRQQPEPCIVAENNSHTEVTHSYYELKEGEMNIDNQQPLSDSSLVQVSNLNPNPDLDPHPIASISHRPLPVVPKPLSNPYDEPDSEHDQNLKSEGGAEGCAPSVSIPLGNVEKNLSKIYYSQYLTCVHESFSCGKCPALSHKATGPFEHCEGNCLKIKFQTL